MLHFEVSYMNSLIKPLLCFLLVEAMVLIYLAPELVRFMKFKVSFLSRFIQDEVELLDCPMCFALYLIRKMTYLPNTSRYGEVPRGIYLVGSAVGLKCIIKFVDQSFHEVLMVFSSTFFTSQFQTFANPLL